MLEIANQFCLEIGVSRSCEPNGSRELLLTFRLPIRRDENLRERCVYLGRIWRQLHRTLGLSHCFDYLMLLQKTICRAGPTVCCQERHVKGPVKDKDYVADQRVRPALLENFIWIEDVWSPQKPLKKGMGTGGGSFS